MHRALDGQPPVVFSCNAQMSFTVQTLGVSVSVLGIPENVQKTRKKVLTGDLPFGIFATHTATQIAKTHEN